MLYVLGVGLYNYPDVTAAAKVGTAPIGFHQLRRDTIGFCEDRFFVSLEAETMKRQQTGALIGALGLVGIGGWLLALALGVPLMGFDRLWPLIPALAGLVFVVQYAVTASRPVGLLFVGMIALLAGTFLCTFTTGLGGLTWRSMVIGVAFMALYLAGDMREGALLPPAYIFGGIGILALPFTLGVMRGEVARQVLQFWPLLVLLIGLAVFFGRHSPGDDDEQSRQ
jgi:hypothetical protein